MTVPLIKLQPSREDADMVVMRSMSVSRQFLLLLSIPFLLVSVLALRLIFQFAHFSAESSRLIQNLQKTVALNQDLRRGITSQINDLHDQFENLNEHFPQKFGETNYTLGETQTEYLKLNIGEQERLTVEKIRALQSELGVKSLQIFERLRIGNRQEAVHRLLAVEQLGERIEEEFAALNENQLSKIREVSDSVNQYVTGSYRIIFVLFASLALIQGLFGFHLKRRVLLPLNSILEASDRIRLGDFSVRAVIQRPDEIGRLAQGFNFMAATLAENYAGLERKVEERTSQIRALQEQLIQSEKMSALGRLVGGVAHELNNPLTAIIGFAELAKMEHDSQNGSSAEARMIKDILSQAERCRRIVANLLQFSRRQEPHMEAVRINEVVEQVLRLREYELASRNIKLVREYDRSNPIICADPNKIQQIALNLLNNAHDAIIEAGRQGEIQVRTSATAGKIILDFIDNGTGIRCPERVFEPFYTTKEVGKGTGLGLSVCYGIVHEHHGEIRAENWERGARITVILPAGDPTTLHSKKEAAPTPAAGVNPAHKPQALIVDDEEMLQRLQVSYLSKMGMYGVGVSTGEAAVRYLEDHKVDVVISDVRMPGPIDGIQLFHWVRKNRPELLHRFLLTSGALIEADDSLHSVDASVPRIRKPFRFNDYARAVRQVMQGTDTHGVSAGA